MPAKPRITEAAAYLRKSRMEEGMETEDVLARHQKALDDYAAKHNIHIVERYCEVKSGESLYARPEMLRLLEDVSDGKLEAVLVMDLDRLSRGRMKDQGIILDAFRDSGTRIITPDKTYDLSDDMDDELAEFKTFMSRREYKIINKRLRRGLEQSIRDGYYVANPPYGYKRVFVDKRPTLEINEDEAAFVRTIFEMYTDGHGCVSIARHINLLGARPHRSAQFSRSSVAAIIKNSVYIGKIVWNKKTCIRKGSRDNDKHITIYNPEDTWTITDGVHPPIINKDCYDTAQSIMEQRFIPSKKDGTIKSSLASLVRCENCGKNMQRMNMHRDPYLLCIRRDCCASAKFHLVEQRVLLHLEETLEELRLAEKQVQAAPNTAPHEKALASFAKEMQRCEMQKRRLYDLLEVGEYDLPLFRERMAIVNEKLEKLAQSKSKIEVERGYILQIDKRVQAEKIATVLASYGDADVPKRNSLLHSVIDSVWYTKTKKSKPNDFRLRVELKPF